MIFSTMHSALAYSVMIAQGNTTDAGDCAAIYEGFNSYSSYNGGKNNRGWSYNNGNYSVSSSRAGASDFKDARNMDVLYWSGHGGKNTTNGPSLNVDARIMGGYAPEFSIKSTLGLNSSATSNYWSGGSLKVVMLSACNQLAISLIKTAMGRNGMQMQ